MRVRSKPHERAHDQPAGQFYRVTFGLSQEPPDFKLIELARIARLAQSLSVQSLKAGRVLSASNLERLKAALATLNEILITAEPDDDGKGHVDPLAAETLKARYRELQRTIQLYNL